MAIYHLTLRGALHTGKYLGVFREAVLDRVPSDSLLAAFMVAWARLGIISTHLPGFENGSPPFTLTSAFPRAGDVRFYPAPPRLPAHAGFAEGDKTAKKLRWLSEGILTLLQDGKTPHQEDAHGNPCFLHGKSTWFTPDESSKIAPSLELNAQGKPGLWAEQVVPRVVVDRVSNASNLFFSGRMTFSSKNSGLWFGVRGATGPVEAALEFLQDEGLGGLRSIGHGAFTWQRADGDLLSAPQDGYGYSLARFAPASRAETGALQNENSVYALEAIGGWCNDDAGQPWRRRSVRMLAEGALLPADGLHGKMVNVRPAEIGKAKTARWDNDRGVYRAGYAFLIPAGKLVEVA